MNISIDLIKQLREMTMASVKDCKACLIEANGDLNLAVELLKKKWISNAAKKADREMNEWIVRFDNREWKLVWLSLWCETDFVSRNDLFLELVHSILRKLSNLNYDVNSINDLDETDLQSMNDSVSELVGKLWENMKLLSVVSRCINDNHIYTYNHSNGKLSSVVTYKPLSENAEDIAKKVAMQSAAMNPEYIKLEDVPTELIQKLKNEAIEELTASWKPANIIENIVAWKVAKQMSEIVLLKQSFIWDETKKIEDLIDGNIEFLACERFTI